MEYIIPAASAIVVAVIEALYDECSVTTNWTTYVSYMVAV